MKRLRRQQRRHHDRQRSILAAAERDGTAQRSPAMNYHFLHRRLLPPSLGTHDPLMPREIVYHSNIAQARLLDEFYDRRRLPRAHFEDQLSIARKMRRRVRHDPA